MSASTESSIRKRSSKLKTHTLKATIAPNKSDIAANTCASVCRHKSRPILKKTSKQNNKLNDDSKEDRLMAALARRRTLLNPIPTKLKIKFISSRFFYLITNFPMMTPFN